MTTRATAPGVYGLLAEFDKPEDVVAATRDAYAAGYRFMEAYTPFPVEGLAEALGFHRNGIARIVLLGGLLGGLGGFFMLWYSSVIHFPLDVGGRPYNSWPAFMPITFELTILVAALSAVLGMLGLNGLPRPHHPVFNVPDFALASRNRFFLCLQARDPLFDVDRSRGFLEERAPRTISIVPF
jgi:Alternative complex III, ActD subunit